MKKLILCLVAYTSFASAQTVTSTCTGPATLVARYKEDASKLAVRHVYTINSTWKDSGKIESSLRDQYLDALLAVYNATAIPARDTVFNYYTIDARVPDLHQINLSADTNLLWVKNLLHNVSPVGNSRVDSLINRHYFKVDTITYLGSVGTFIVLHTDTASNIAPIAYRLLTVSGVYSADPYYFIGDGSDITDSLASNYTELIFAYAWGDDCPSGCSNRHYWKFRVYSDCSVEFKGNSGSALVGIKENTLLANAIQVYPNPARDILTVSYENPIVGLSYSIFNTLGEKLSSGICNESKDQISVGKMPSGIYIVKFDAPAGQTQFRVIKE